MNPDRPQQLPGSCPDPGTLAAYSIGKLPVEDTRAIAEHVECCESCAEALEDFDNDDTLIAALRRHVPASPAPDDPVPEMSPPARDNRDSLRTSHGPAEGQRLGSYKLLEKIGQGAMGVVYKAWQITLDRPVALKLALPVGLLSLEARARFRTEGKAIARLDHPNIIRVHDFEEQDGQLYFSMELVEGQSLAQKLSEGPLPEQEAAELVRTLALAVAFAHQQGVIHRDLKPANVLLAADGSVKLSDFGLAKILDTEDGQTQGEMILGTPSYMAPEQARGDVAAVGTLADVYGLGAILYEALTGQPPFRAASRAETLFQVQNRDPVPPSRLRPGLSRSLEAICRRCLEKDPRHRYATAGHLADDLQRYLTGQRLLPPWAPWWWRMLIWTKRRLRALAVLAVGLLALPMIFVGYRMVQTAARVEEERRLEVAWNARSKGLELCNGGDIGPGLLWLARALNTAPEPAGDLHELLRLDLDAWRLRWPALTAEFSHPDKVWSVQFSPDGRTALTLYHDQARLWEADTGEPLGEPLAHPARVFAASFSADGRTVRTLCDDGCFRTWSTATRELLHSEPARCARDLTPGQRGDRTADLLWEFKAGTPPARPIPASSSIWRLDFSPDRRAALTLSFANEARLRRADTAESLHDKVRHPGALWDATFSPDGGHVLTAGEDRTVRFWKTEGLVEDPPALEHPGPVHSVAFDPGGRLLATGDTDAVRLWDPASRKLHLGLPRQSMVRTLAFSPDGQRLGSGHGDIGVRLWKLPPRSPSPLVHPLADLPRGVIGPDGLRRETYENGIRSVVFHPDGRRILSVGVDAAVRLWDAETGLCIGAPVRHTDAIGCLALHPDSRTLVAGSRDGMTRLWDLETGNTIGPPLETRHNLGGAAFSPDGTVLAMGLLALRTLRIQDLATARCEAEFGPLDGVFDLAFSPNGRTVLAGSKNHAHLCDRDTGGRRDLPHDTPVFATAFHPAGHTFVTGTQSGQLRWWNVATLDCEAVIPAHADRVRRAAFSAGGEVVATVGWDKRLCFWHTRTRQAVGPPVRLPDCGNAVAFHPDGRTVLAGCKNGRISFAPVPRAVPGTPRQVLLRVQVLTGLELDPGDVPRPLDTAVWRQRRQQLESDGGTPW